MYESVWPRGRQVGVTVSPARRLDTLQGKTVCLLWNWLFRGDEIFPLVEKELSKRYPGLKFVGYEEFRNIHGKDERRVFEALGEKLHRHKCDAVITGVGC